MPPKAELGALSAELTVLYGEHSAGLLSYANSISKSREASRDAVQEVFLRYFTERKYGAVIENPKAWLYRVLYYYSIDRLQAAARKSEIAVEHSEAVADASFDPEAKVQRIQAARDIASWLSPRELHCLRLRAEGYSYSEIASVLGIRRGTVSALLTRVYSKLRIAAGAGNGIPIGISEVLVDLFSGDKAYLS